MAEFRKVQRTGRNTFTLSLPREWAVKNNLSSGAPLYINENYDGTLNISVTSRERGQKRARIATKESMHSALQDIVASYIAGCNEVEVSGIMALAACDEARIRLTGMEIVNETPESTQMKVLIKGNEFTLDELIRREFNITKTVYDLLLSTFSKGEDHRVEIARRDNEVDRLHLLLLRCIDSAPGTPGTKAMKAIIGRNIEVMNDQLEYLSSIAKTISPNKNLADALREVRLAYTKSFDYLSGENIGMDPSRFLSAVEKEVKMKCENALRGEKNAHKLFLIKSVAERMLVLLRYARTMFEMKKNLNAMEQML